MPGCLCCGAAGRAEVAEPSEAADAMKGIQVTKYGAPDDVVRMATNIPKPSIKAASKDVLVKVMAAALNPGDMHKMRGAVSAVISADFPYTPGMDVCGLVEAVGDQCTEVQVGDMVIADVDVNAGTLQEYTVVTEDKVARKPSNLSPVEAAGLPVAGVTALTAIEEGNVQQGDRVLVLGGSGGIGSIIIQILRNHSKTSFIAATSSSVDLVQSLGADVVINYKEKNWWEELRELDVIIDCAGGGWPHATRKVFGSKKMIFVPVTVTLNPMVATIPQLVGFAVPSIGRSLGSAVLPWVPKYKMVMSGPDGAKLKALAKLAADGLVKPTLDPHTPYDFSEEAVLEALRLQDSHRAKGKLVVKVSDV